MRGSNELQRDWGVREPVGGSEDQRAELEPVDDPGLAARGIVLGCCISLGIWLTVLVLVM